MEWKQSNADEFCSQAAKQFTNNNPDLNYSPATLEWYERTLDGIYLMGVNVDGLEADGGLFLIASYLGEVIRKNIGGEWICVEESPKSRFFLIKVNSYFVNPLFEVAWKLTYGNPDQITQYYNGLVAEVTRLRMASKYPTNTPYPYVLIFPANYLERLAAFRALELANRGRNLCFLNAQIPEMNKFFH